MLHISAMAHIQHRRQGETITVTAEGEDEAAAIEAVEKFLTENV